MVVARSGRVPLHLARHNPGPVSVVIAHDGALELLVSFLHTSGAQQQR